MGTARKPSDARPGKPVPGFHRPHTGPVGLDRPPLCITARLRPNEYAQRMRVKTLSGYQRPALGSANKLDWRQRAPPSAPVHSQVEQQPCAHHENWRPGPAEKPGMASPKIRRSVHPDKEKDKTYASVHN